MCVHCRSHMICDLTNTRTLMYQALCATSHCIYSLAYRSSFKVMRVAFQAITICGTLDDVQSIHAVTQRVYLLSLQR